MLWSACDHIQSTTTSNQQDNDVQRHWRNPRQEGAKPPDDIPRTIWGEVYTAAARHVPSREPFRPDPSSSPTTLCSRSSEISLTRTQTHQTRTAAAATTRPALEVKRQDTTGQAQVVLLAAMRPLLVHLHLRPGAMGSNNSNSNSTRHRLVHHRVPRQRKTWLL